MNSDYKQNGQLIVSYTYFIASYIHVLLISIADGIFMFMK